MKTAKADTWGRLDTGEYWRHTVMVGEGGAIHRGILGHLKCIIVSMKPLALILLLAVTAECQSLAEASRKERERRAGVTSTRVIIIDGRTIPTPETREAPASAPASAETPAAPAKPVEKTAAVVAAPVVDPVQQWNQQVQMLAVRIHELEDQERTFLAQFSDSTVQLSAPISTQDSNNQALVRIADAQNKLMAVRVQLDNARSDLAIMALQGPPRR